MKRAEKLIKDSYDIVTKDFKSLKDAKNYAKKLHNETNAEKEKLVEQVKELNYIINELERAQSYTFSYWLNVKE